MLNDELISRKEVIDRLQKAQNVFLKESPLEACGISYAREIIASEVEIPTIEKRPEGEWITEDVVKPYGICSQCGVICEIDNYCGNCGAKMKDGAE